MKTSVLVITRNRAKLLRRCLLSLAEQTKIPNEVIVVDNVSKDNTKEIALSFGEKLHIKYFKEKKIGIPFARNKGLKHATGDIILMIDDDCKATEFWVERMIKAHQKHPNAWVIQGKTFSVPRERVYSIIAEFNRYLSLKGNAKDNFLSFEELIQKDFSKEFSLLACDTKNLSIKNKYLKKYHLLFDEKFYRGSDSDLGRQIISNGGSILFSPNANVYHWERASLEKFLEQRWHIGRTAVRIEDKWSLPPKFRKNAIIPKLEFLFLFCKKRVHWKTIPISIALTLLDKIYYLNGRFYEKRLANH